MRRGKKKCETLKAIRREVAKANGIDYEPTKCDYEGECKGTCPKCDAELAELQSQLDAKEQKGESVKYESQTTEMQLVYDEDPLTEEIEKLITDVDGWADLHYDEFRILLDVVLALIGKRSVIEHHLKGIDSEHEQVAFGFWEREFESFCCQSKTRVERKLLSLRRSWEKRTGSLEPTGTTEELDFLKKKLISLRDVKGSSICEETTERRYQAELDFLRNMTDFLEKRKESLSSQSGKTKKSPEIIRLTAELCLIEELFRLFECGGLTGMAPFEYFYRHRLEVCIREFIPEQKMGERTSCIGTIFGISVIAWILLYLFAK